MSPAPAPPRQKRPAIVTIIVLLFVVETLTVGVVVWIYLAEIGVFSREFATMVAMELGDVQGPALTVRAILWVLLFFVYVVATYGLMRLRTWAWTLAMVLLGVRLAFGLGDYLFNSPAFELLFICVVLVFMLNQRRVRQAYGIVKEKRATADVIQFPS